jgi:cytochrome c oxidase subunit 3
MGGINTVVLIASSLTWRSRCARRSGSKTTLTVAMLAMTIACACVFLVIKYFEYSHKFHEGCCRRLPRRRGFQTGYDAGIFFAVYFMMTGVHGLHVVIGIGLITWILVRAAEGAVLEPLLRAGRGRGPVLAPRRLIWIYLFPLLYLVG